MNLSDESISEFQEIWKKEYGKEISKKEAHEYGTKLIGFFQILFAIDKDD